MKICICGGGSLGHVCAGVLGSNKDVAVSILTRRPERWSHTLTVKDLDDKYYKANIPIITSSPEEALRGCNIVFLCLPGFAIRNELQAIRSWFTPEMIVGSIVCSTGFFFFAHELLNKDARLFGFQRTPFIARTAEYGHSASLLGYKPQVAIATENIPDRESFRQLVEKLWLTPTTLLDSHYEVSLTNSNPILHTGRLYTMFRDWQGQPFDHNILFYREWTDESSQKLIDMDKEFMLLLDHLPIRKGAIPTLLEYYESYDAKSLTQKISTIPAFQNILSPMKEVSDGWVPDFQSRYFSEDFPYGLRFIVELADQHNIPSHHLHEVYTWGISKYQQP